MFDFHKNSKKVKFYDYTEKVLFFKSFLLKSKLKLKEKMQHLIRTSDFTKEEILDIFDDARGF